jgi:large-conductance mechanosensitive channel
MLKLESKICWSVSLSPSWRELSLRSAPLGQGVILGRRVIAFANIFYSLSSAQNSIIEFETQIIIKFNFQSILFLIFLYVKYYALLLR